MDLKEGVRKALLPGMVATHCDGLPSQTNLNMYLPLTGHHNELMCMCLIFFHAYLVIVV